MFNGYQLYPFNLPSESSPLSSSGIEITLFGYVTGSNQCLYQLYHVSLRTSVYEFLGIINLMSSATILPVLILQFLLLSLHVVFFFFFFFFNQSSYLEGKLTGEALKQS